jgi:cell division protein FtsQ
MSEKRKISVRKILQATFTALVSGTCVFALLSASSLERREKIKEIQINIRNSQYGFIDKKEIETFLANNHNGDILNASIGKLNENKIEHTVVTNPWVDKAEVYVDNDKTVHINLTQRVPVARLFDQAGNSYYLDRSMKPMPLSEKYIHYTTVVTNVPVLKDDSIGNALKAQIAAVVTYIDKDSFWSAQVSQVIVTNDRTFELVPVLGNQKIVLGDTSRLDEKFNNLLLFYKKVLNRIGWEKYETLDLRFAGQVVASPKLPYKAPGVNASVDMNWVKTLMGKDSNMYRVDSSTMRIKQTRPAVVVKNAFVGAAATKLIPKPKTENKAAPVKPKVDNKPATKVALAKPTAKKPEPKAKPPVKTMPKKIEKKPEKKEKNLPKKKEQTTKEQQPKYLYQ